MIALLLTTTTQNKFSVLPAEGLPMILLSFRTDYGLQENDRVRTFLKSSIYCCILSFCYFIGPAANIFWQYKHLFVKGVA